MSSPSHPPTDPLAPRGPDPAAPDTAFATSLTRGCEAQAQAHLVQIYPRDAAVGSRYAVTHAPVVIGRDADCEACCLDPSVSRTHARVELRPDGAYRVTDLDSRNGTFVNDDRVRERALRDGDNVRVGNAVFRFLGPGNLEANYHAEIHRRAALDPLTGLHNRRALAERLAREVIAAARHGRPLSVVMFDVDHFKTINDRFGHAAGDRTLKALAAVAAELARREDLLARYGGEEFVLVLPDADPAQAHACGERVRASVAARAFAFEDRTFAVTVSVGTAGFRAGEWLLPTELIRRADEQLYEAKRGGRNRVCSAGRDEARPPAPSVADLQAARPGGTVHLVPGAPGAR